MIKVGIVGMGVIGTHIAKAIENGIPGITLAGVSVRTADHGRRLSSLLARDADPALGPDRRGRDPGGAPWSSGRACCPRAGT